MNRVTVDAGACTRCGTCSTVCPLSVIVAGEGDAPPSAPPDRLGRCIGCGQCEVLCPAGALVLGPRDRPLQRVPPGTGFLSPDEIGLAMRLRRSVRHYTGKPVAEETIGRILDIVRYAPSGTNSQPVRWIVFHDPAGVRRVAGHTIGWMESCIAAGDPLSGFYHRLVQAWEKGNDVICRKAPHLLVAHIPCDNPVAPVDAVIALTHFDLAAPAFGVGTCWAGFVSIAAAAGHRPLLDELALPPGRRFGYAMVFGHPEFPVRGIPERNPAHVTWR